MPRAPLVTVIFCFLVNCLAPLALAASTAPPAPVVASGIELVAANPGGASTAILLIDYESVAGRQFGARLAAFARGNPHVKIVVRPVGGGGPLSEFLGKAAYAAARQGRFATFHEYALAAAIADTWYSLRDNASRAGLDWARFQRDYMDPAIAEDVRVNRKFAEEHKLTAFPAFVAGGRGFSGPWEVLNLADVSAAAK